MLTKLGLLLMRVGTGLLLVWWGTLRLLQDGTGANLANKYYGGVAADSTLQLAYAGFEVALGTLVVLGLFRKYTLIGSAVILVGGALMIWRHLIDPLGLFLFAAPGDANLLFLPSITVAGAALALIGLRGQDKLALDRVIGKKR